MHAIRLNNARCDPRIAQIFSNGAFEISNGDTRFSSVYNTVQRCSPKVVEFLPARRYASAGGPVSASLCVCHKSVFYRNG